MTQVGGVYSRQMTFSEHFDMSSIEMNSILLVQDIKCRAMFYVYFFGNNVKHELYIPLRVFQIV